MKTDRCQSDAKACHGTVPRFVLYVKRSCSGILDGTENTMFIDIESPAYDSFGAFGALNTMRVGVLVQQKIIDKKFTL